MKKMLMASVLVSSSIFASIALAETPVKVSPSIFMDVKQVVSDTPAIAYSPSDVNYKRCEVETRTMVFRDSQGSLKSMDYQVSNQVGCSDGDGGTHWGS